jgi:hypothetical protein
MYLATFLATFSRAHQVTLKPVEMELVPTFGPANAILDAFNKRGRFHFSLWN